MRQKMSVILLLAISISLVPTQSGASAGAKCSKSGQLKTVGVEKSKCVKKGTSLNWAVVGSKAPPEIVSFADAVARPNDVSYWAWKKSHDQIARSADLGPRVQLLVGPNTKLSNPNPQAAIDLVTRMFPNVTGPEKVYGIYHSFKDNEWSQKQFDKLAIRSQGVEAKNQCQTVNSCWGGQGEISSNGDGILLISVMSKNPTRNHTSGTLEAHEYAHVLQVSAFKDTPNKERANCCLKAFFPWWLVEGGAEFIQITSIYWKSFPLYVADRNFWAEEFLLNREKKFTEAWVLNFLKPPSTEVWTKPENNWRLYDVGMLVSEIFTAIKGPQVNMELFSDVASGMSFEDAFSLRFGITWEEAAPLIAKSIVKLKKAS